MSKSDTATDDIVRCTDCGTTGDEPLIPREREKLDGTPVLCLKCYSFRMATPSDDPPEEPTANASTETDGFDLPSNWSKTPDADHTAHIQYTATLNIDAESAEDDPDADDNSGDDGTPVRVEITRGSELPHPTHSPQWWLVR